MQSDIQLEFVDGRYIWPYKKFRNFCPKEVYSSEVFPLNIGNVEFNIDCPNQLTLPVMVDQFDSYQYPALIYSIFSNCKRDFEGGNNPMRNFNSRYNQTAEQSPDIDYDVSVILGFIKDRSIFPDDFKVGKLAVLIITILRIFSFMFSF